jgi:DNA-binding beta-propeller fold protein YncE
MVSTFAGTGAAGAADGPAAAAEFNYPYSLAADSAGNVYVADSNNNLIRRISGGMVAAFAGTGANRPFQDGPVASATFHFPRGVAVDSAGNIYAADAGNHLIRKIAPVYNTP